MNKIKHIIRNSFIYLVSILGIVSIYRKKKQGGGPLVRVIAFHDVSNKKWFEEVITMLVANYHVVTPRQFHNREFDTQKINILLTFDDGYQSWIEIVLPALRTHNLKALFFVCSGLLAVASDTSASDSYMSEQLHIVPKEAMSLDGAKQLITNGHTVGGHTVDHANLQTLNSKEVKQEIEEDKVALETEFNIKIQDFAYPFGTSEHYNAEIQKQALVLGYTYIYNAKTGFVDTNATDIPRTLIEKEQPIASIKRWIEGGYDLFCTIKGG